MTEGNVPEVSRSLSRRAQSVHKVMGTSTNLHLPDNSRLVLQHTIEGRGATKAAVFLDRDGVIVEDIHFVKSPSQLRILPGAAEAVRMLQDQFYIIVVTNQSGIARGLLTEEDLLEIHLQLVQRLASEGAVVDALYYCPHLPEATVKAYRRECDCRKPKPGLLLQAKHDWGIEMADSYMVGDTPRDIEAGCAAGLKGMLLGNKKAAPPAAHDLATDLPGAARLILRLSDTQIVGRRLASLPEGEAGVAPCGKELL